jgi:hypothetical protein
VDAMTKEEKQAEVYGDRQRSKQKYSLRLPLQNIQWLSAKEEIRAGTELLMFMKMDS